MRWPRSQLPQPHSALQLASAPMRDCEDGELRARPVIFVVSQLHARTRRLAHGDVDVIKGWMAARCIPRIAVDVDRSEPPLWVQNVRAAHVELQFLPAKQRAGTELVEQQ